ncbi:hypothetical protein O0555_06095 [Brevibacillus laterosporus]|uniref:hypothetical protein n=1 Tax=Brevibacillus laterosporus TaxID=1465 RepID=UPI000CE43032|nr:hypothetical protein [Brevibacillus laterosporus]MBG9774121.1 hypothetical protein [Brevibacillus laterosporus]MBG9798145.1 hypothetical protein [Brevibacillus laterosporus]MCR8936923.1 hypothetical protein [Brevibacillus laterosporus]MCZ0839561.1 hypothetical protein [Brevibacillus laterosporus]MCZ0845691.1 hypothetical protein [Brevibacillus laterosporus]
MNVTVMNIGLFLAIVIFLISLFIKNKKIPKKSYVIIYILNIIILCVVLGNYFSNTPSGAGSNVIPIFYILVILLNLQQIIRGLKNNNLK